VEIPRPARPSTTSEAPPGRVSGTTSGTNQPTRPSSTSSSSFSPAPLSSSGHPPRIESLTLQSLLRFLSVEEIIDHPRGNEFPLVRPPNHPRFKYLDYSLGALTHHQITPTAKYIILWKASPSTIERFQQGSSRICSRNRRSGISFWSSEGWLAALGSQSRWSSAVFKPPGPFLGHSGTIKSTPIAKCIIRSKGLPLCNRVLRGEGILGDLRWCQSNPTGEWFFAEWAFPMSSDSSYHSVSSSLALATDDKKTFRMDIFRHNGIDLRRYFSYMPISWKIKHKASMTLASMMWSSR